MKLSRSTRLFPKHKRFVNRAVNQKWLGGAFAVSMLVLGCGEGADDLSLQPIPTVETVATQDDTAIDGGTATQDDAATHDDAGTVGSTALADAPTDLAPVGSHTGAVELTWQPPTSGNVTGYVLTRANSTGLQKLSTSGTSFRDEGLVDGDFFTYQVAAVNEAGVGPASNTVTVQVGSDTTPPTTPTKPEYGDNRTLTWASSSDPAGIERYEVIRSANGTDSVFAVREPEFVDDLPVGTIVTYEVRAVDTHGNVSEVSRSTTVLSGTSTENSVVVISALADPAMNSNVARLRNRLLADGHAVAWFEDGEFDANVVGDDDTVLILGDAVGESFDWNLFGSKAGIIAMKSAFVQSAGITENAPKLDRISNIAFGAPGTTRSSVNLWFVARPSTITYIPPTELLSSVEAWGVQGSNVVAGVIREGETIANGQTADGCRAFFPGNTRSLNEQTKAGDDALADFVQMIVETC